MEDLNYLCDKETFLKLKEINKVLTKAKHAYAAWVRAKRKTVHKKPAPNLSKYSVFLEEHSRLDRPYGKESWRSGNRSKRSVWLKTDTRCYTYFDTMRFEYWNLSRKQRRGDVLSNEQKEKLNDSWFCMHTFYVDEEYTRARRPYSLEYIAENPLKISKKTIEELYDTIKEKELLT